MHTNVQYINSNLFGEMKICIFGGHYLTFKCNFPPALYNIPGCKITILSKKAYLLYKCYMNIN